ncbi:hypothetical protein G6F38_011558 [Rhizopus arrhizus]|nr:hypothetical protein G6F38_011558 [Rhizopus arrhizus]
MKFFAQQSKRKKNDLDERVSARSLYVMKDKHIIEVLNNVVNFLPKYQEYIQQLKDQDLLKVMSTTQKVCLVTLDTAGLTTSKDDLASFLR